MAPGVYYTCALLEGGRVRCWGSNDKGQLGYREGSRDSADTVARPSKDVAVGGRAIDLAAGGEHTCALLKGGRVRCWGANDRGQAGVEARDLDGAIVDARVW
jgi:alpha-tubulin suppressor-like RCC1 family protein